MREWIQSGRRALVFEALGRRPELRHLFTTRDRNGGGNTSLSGGRDREKALQERSFWSSALGVSSADLVVGELVHGRNVARVGEAHRGRGARGPAAVLPATDGLITACRGLPLFLPVADCAAVLLFAPGEAPVLGVAHAGWRGLRVGILSALVEAMEEPAGMPPSAWLAGISPAIGLTHFEVGDEVAAAAPPSRRVRLQGRTHVDLAGWAHDQLREAGLAPGNIEAAGLDTAERADLFFSHRRDGEPTGRMGLLAVLADAPPGAAAPRS